MNDNSNLAYDNVIGNNFWYEFDNTFFWRMSHDVADAIDDTMKLEGLYNSHRNSGTFPDQYLVEIRQEPKMEESTKFLVHKQLSVIDKHFGKDNHSLQLAFEDFGQGTLYDNRPPRSKARRIHMMDENAYGYKVWHIFVRTGYLLRSNNNDFFDDCLKLSQLIGLASDIHIRQQPSQSSEAGDNPSNPKIDPIILDKCRIDWLSKSFEEVDIAFDKNVYTPMRNRFMNRMKNLKFS